MKRLFIVLFCVVLTGALFAQEKTGNINGLVVDRDKNPLPGVNVTLTGPTIAPMTTQSNAEGRFRFLSLFPGNEYTLKLELQGFKTRVEERIIVNVGINADLVLTLEQGKIEEQVTVIATTPMVQAKKTQITHNVSYDALQSLPSARDPWVMLQLTPGLFIDRENVGGNESGQQSTFMQKGTTTQEWTLDGVQITDLSSGGSPGYFDFDAFEEMQISTGQLDVEHRSPGTVINLVTRRGQNRMSLAGRFYWTDQNFQATLSPQEIANLGVPGYNHILDIKDFGFNVGGPVLKDKIWWWGSYGIQEIKTIVAAGTSDNTFLTNLDAKLNFQLIPENRAEIFVQAGKKEKFGRSASLSVPLGWNQYGKYHFGSPTISIQDQHMFGDNLFVTVRYGFTDAGFGMWPVADEKIQHLVWYNIEKNLYENGQTWWFSGRPHTFAVAQIQYFNDNLLGTGTSHEMKLGFELNNNSATSTGYEYPGNFYIRYNYNTLTVDWNGDGKQDTGQAISAMINPTTNPVFGYFSVAKNAVDATTGTDRYSVYFSDSVAFSRFNLNLGVRADQLRPWRDARSVWTILTQDKQYSTYMHEDSRNNYWNVQNSVMDINVAKAIYALNGEKTQPAVTPGKYWTTFSPRLGLTYDVFGDGKTILKAAYSLFPGSGLGTGPWTASGLSGSFGFYWADLNNDKFITLNELYWADYSKTTRPAYRAFDDNGNFVGNIDREKGLMWSGFDWYNKDAFTPGTTHYDVDGYKVSLTHEVSVSLEREIFKDFGVSATFSFRRYGRYAWSRSYYPSTVDLMMDFWSGIPNIVAPAASSFFPNLDAAHLNHIRDRNDYMIGGYVPQTLTITKSDGSTQTFDFKDAAGRPWYVMTNDPWCQYTDYSYYTMAPANECNKFWGWDFVFNKRLSNKWMLSGSFTWQTERTYWGDAWNDPTTKWAYDGSLYGISLGGNSGKTGVNFFSRWLFKIAAMYQLPWDVNVSATTSGHEGAFVGESFTLRDQNLPNSRSYSNSMPTVTYDNRDKLPDVWDINFKLEKMLRVGDTGRVYFAFDLFNVINAKTILRRYDNSYGTWTIPSKGTDYTTYSAPSSTNYKPIEIMNPLCYRFGVRFQF
jgi:hypothetical protein